MSSNDTAQLAKVGDCLECGKTATMSVFQLGRCAKCYLSYNDTRSILENVKANAQPAPRMAVCAMCKTHTTKQLKPLSEVMQVYSGKPGCACGCNGKYYPEHPENGDKPTAADLKMFKKVYKLFEQNLHSIETSEEGDFCWLDVSDNRTYTIYWNKEVSQ